MPGCREALFIQRRLVRIWIDRRKNVFLVDDDSPDDLVDVWLELDLISISWNRQKSWTEADGQVVRVHHILVAELGQASKHSSRCIQSFNCPSVLGYKSGQTISVSAATMELQLNTTGTS